MPHLALALALTALGAIWVPVWGKYAAVGCGLLALVAGIAGLRRAPARGSGRIEAACAAALGAVALLLGLAKVGLTLAAIARLREMI